VKLFIVKSKPPVLQSHWPAQPPRQPDPVYRVDSKSNKIEQKP